MDTFIAKKNKSAQPQCFDHDLETLWRLSQVTSHTTEATSHIIIILLCQRDG